MDKEDASGRPPARRADRFGRDDRRTGPPPFAGPRRERTDHGLGGDQIEGRQAVRELLAAGRRPVREVWISDGLEPSAQIDEIEQLAAKRHVRVLLVAKRKLESAARTEAPQGVLAKAKPLDEADFDQLARGSRGMTPFLLVLDGVTDPHNVGSLLRSAETAGVTGVVLARHRAAHVTPAVAKVAAGAVEHVPIAVVAGIPAALTSLSRVGVQTIGLDGTAERSLYDLELDDERGVALVVGAEGHGLAPLVKRRCDVLAAIPLRGAIASLNVASAGAVACFELARRRSPSR